MMAVFNGQVTKRVATGGVSIKTLLNFHSVSGKTSITEGVCMM